MCQLNPLLLLTPSLLPLSDLIFLCSTPPPLPRAAAKWPYVAALSHSISLPLTSPGPLSGGWLGIPKGDPCFKDPNSGPRQPQNPYSCGRVETSHWESLGDPCLRPWDSVGSGRLFVDFPMTCFALFPEELSKINKQTYLKVYLEYISKDLGSCINLRPL